MQIDPKTEQLLTFAEACRAVPPDGISRATLFRWVQKGIKGRRLESLTIGGKRYCSREAIDRFIDAGNAADAPAPTFTVEQRQRMSIAARETLATEYGI